MERRTVAVVEPSDSPEWWLAAAPPCVVDRVRSPTCQLRWSKDAPSCGRPAAYRAQFHYPDAPPERRDAASHVCAEHGTWARYRPHLVQLRSLRPAARP